MRDTRSSVILHHLNLAIHHSSLTFRSYAALVRDVYNQRTPLAARGIHFHVTRDPYADERANAQILKRIMDEPASIPADLEESLVLCLPSPYQGECCRELAARIGQLAASIPSDGHAAAVADAAALMRETGEALGNLTDIEACVATLKARLMAATAAPIISQLKKAG